MAPGGIEPPHAASKAAALSAELRGPAAIVADRLRVTDGTRTHNHRDHNPGLYQLSYGHLAPNRITGCGRTRACGGLALRKGRDRRRGVSAISRIGPL